MAKIGEFSRNVLVILTGTLAAQAIGIVVSPVLTRLYGPEDFGVYALFMSILTLLGAVGCGRYEMGITLPARDRDGLALLALCTGISLAFAVVLVPVLWLAGDKVVASLGDPRLSAWLWYVPGALFITGFSTGARYWLLRKKAFSDISKNNILRAVLTTSFNIFAGYFAGWVHYGLVGGILFSLCAGTLFFAVRIWRESGVDLKSLRWAEVKAQAYEHRGFPLYSTGSALVESGASQIPVFFFSSLYGAGTLGFFSFAQRIANMPLTMVASSIADVFRQQASEVYAREGNCLHLFNQTFKKLFWLSLPAFVLGAWISPWVFALVFGPAWRESGEYVRLLIPALALRFVSNPLSSMFYIARRQGFDLLIQSVLIVVMLVAFGWAGRPESGWTARTAIIAYSAIYSMKYLVELVLARQFAKGGSGR